MKKLIETLRRKKTGYGHFSISIEMDGQKFKTTTTKFIKKTILVLNQPL